MGEENEGLTFEQGLRKLIMDQSISDLEMLGKVSAMLMDRFDSVQIFTTRHSGSTQGTTQFHWGNGNWYARYGHVKAWVEDEDEKLRIATRIRCAMAAPPTEPPEGE